MVAIVGRVYKLINPKTSEIIYVGSTVMELKKRLDGHLICIKNNNQQKIYCYCRKNKIKPTIEQVEQVMFSDVKELRKREYWWISELGRLGNPLLNHMGNIDIINEGRPIIQMCCDDMTLSEISKTLKISITTLTKRLERIRKAVGVKTPIGLLVYYYRNGMVS